MTTDYEKDIVVSRLSNLKNRIPLSDRYRPIIVALGSGSNTVLTIDEMIDEIIGDTVIGNYYVESEIRKLGY